MSWIDDAKKEVREQRGRIILAEKKEFSLKLSSFHLRTSKTKQEIEKVLNEARRQSLIVEGPDEGYLYNIKATAGFLCQKSPLDPRYNRNYDYFDWWAYRWKISLPQEEIDNLLKSRSGNTNCVLVLYLSLNKADGESVPAPTTSAEKVEKEIKDWLYDIYKDEY